MPKHSVPSSKILIASLLMIIISLPWSGSHAATPVFADPNLACAGFTPCYATLQEAINNAGPAPAEVGVFPGVYAESVDLSLMGSAIGQAPGSIVLQALSSMGGATDSGVQIDPAAAGGPGSGPGLSTGAMGPFEGDVFLSGLSITSPDTSALGISMIGNLTIADLVTENAASIGIVGMVEGNLSLARANASMNGASGIVLDITGSASVSDVEALQNADDGLLLVVTENLTAQGITSSGNENGVQFYVCQDADIRMITTAQNVSNGTTIFYGTDDCQPSAPNSTPGPGSSFNENSLFNPDVRVRGSTAGTLYAETIESEDNGNAGIGITSTTGAAQLDGLFANDNAGIGIFLQSPQVELNDGEANRNRSGLFALSDQISMTRVIANLNQAPMSDLPAGSGVFVSASIAVLDDVQADSNSGAGLVLSETLDASIPDYSVVDSQFDGNPIGILADSAAMMGSGGPVNVILDTIFLTGNQDAGLSMAELEAAAFSNVSVNGSEIGMELSVAGQLSIETSDIIANTTGVRIEIERDQSARITCSTIAGNTTVGLELAQGSALPAKAIYWGDPTGPTHPDNPGGTGDVVLDFATGSTGVVNYTGFLAQPATQADCPQQIADAVPVPALSLHGLGMLLIGMVLTGLLTMRRAWPS